MPIKLLHHKSWHVYSLDNIARVARDEAAEEARLAAERTATLEASSASRLRQLRHEISDSPVASIALESGGPSQRKRKRENEMAILDRQLRSEAVDVPQSEYAGKKEDETFAKLAKPSWYETRAIEGDARHAKKTERRKDVLDPLNEMKAHLARKKEMKRQREREHERDRDGENYEPDRYHSVPAKPHAPEHSRVRSSGSSRGTRKT